MGAGSLFSSHRFAVHVNGVMLGGCTEVGGLSDEIEVETVPEGGQDSFLLQLPTRVRHSRIVLKRGMIGMDMRIWFDLFRKFQVVNRRSLDVFQLNDLNERRYVWHFQEAFPVKWSGPSFNSQSSGLTFESIELVHHGMDLIQI